MATLSLTDVQRATGAVAGFSAVGKPSPITGVPVWVSSDPTVAAVVAAADGLSAVVTAVAAGSASISVSITQADGTVLPAVSTPVVVSGSPAVGFSVTFGDPTDVPAPAVV